MAVPSFGPYRTSPGGTHSLKTECSLFPAPVFPRHWNRARPPCNRHRRPLANEFVLEGGQVSMSLRTLASDHRPYIKNQIWMPEAEAPTPAT